MAEVQQTTDFGAPFIDLQSERNTRAMTANGLIRGVMAATATLDFGSIAANLAADLTVTVNGARANDLCMVAPPAAPDAEISFTAFVSANDTVTVRAANNSAGAVNPASATYRVVVFNFTA